MSTSQFCLFRAVSLVDVDVCSTGWISSDPRFRSRLVGTDADGLFQNRTRASGDDDDGGGSMQ